MSLKIYKGLKQRSEEWYEARCGIVTASVVGSLITATTLKPADNDTARKLTMSLVAERITGFVDPTFQSVDMFRGMTEEPIARDVYSGHHGAVEECGFMVRDDWGYRIGYSPDGLVGSDGLIEIKCPRQKEHLRTILADEVPAQYMAQIQTGLLVSGRSWCDYVSFYGGMPLWTKRVHADQRWADAIVHAAGLFEGRAKQMVAQYRASVRGLPITERIPDLYAAELRL